ncbi:Activator of Hsp90 ATPase 1 family protein [Gordonia bronchialis DSM 43247]|uniref:Activator of Hsp90 ATPase 1 family protein n=2 Tax=Actinomycetes TaxID=1760 RepID=D0LCA6_GORB4|nr:SRPBCC domain-containing protein [Gordonia bronchialis]ACY19630.1 Activator of Hsp90 ATPase 1 family protein [Gordonia bronchialis DSM 43247]MCC3322407.1 SRPBCC domain-containing protein [Gordonia bronchialis]QGS26462.1 SRPBCC domain-containing protein [Gordonia bronchialis]UAK37202.1 SRPBCC domain-containing protein [Gordonia bronchialis]STQ62391.1 Activator of Hsp90 ATPase homolog 1-like protein [Gordonia bronchialis]
MTERTATAQFTITRIFDAPRELVWRAWTETADAAEWWHPRDVWIKAGTVSVDARAGGRYAYTMVGPDGREYPTSGVYREVTPPERLVFTWGSPGDADDEAPLITVTLRELDGHRTEMLFHLVGIDAAPGDEDVYDGWNSAFDLLGEHLDAAER